MISIDAIPPAVTRMVEALGWALLHSVWQGAGCAAGLLASDVALRRSRPEARYLCACLALLLCLALPASTAFQQMSQAAGGSYPGPSNPSAAGFESAWAPSPGTQHRAQGLGAELVSALESMRPMARRTMPWAVGMWGAGVLVLSLRLLGGWWIARRLARGRAGAEVVRLRETLERLVRRMRISAPVRIFESALVEVPTVVGWLRPVILVPVSVLACMPPAQLEALLAHELEHIRRLDYLANLAQAWVETLLFYHPAAWWISSRIRAEREHCCDDAAVAACRNPALYGRALEVLEQHRGRTPRLLPAATGGSLLLRIRRLAGQRIPVAPPRGFAALILVSSALAMAAVTAAGSTPAVRRAARASWVRAERMGAWVARGRLSGPMRWAGPVRLPSARVAPVHGVPADEALAAPAVAEAPDAEALAGSEADREVLADNGAGGAELAELDRLGNGNLSAAEILRLQEEGVGSDYVAAMNRAFGSRLTAAQLALLKQEDVDARYASELCESGRAPLSPEDVVRLRAEDVSGAYVAELRALGLGHLAVEEWIALRTEDVSASFISSMMALGLEDLTAGQLIRLRQEDVTPGFVRRIRREGYEGTSVEELIRFRQRGPSVGAISQEEDAYL